MRDSGAGPRYSIIESHVERDVVSFAEEVEAGLSERPKSLPCRFLYDEAGSKLFEEICDLPEYYPTRAEREILENNADDLAAIFHEPITLAELGSGSSTKTRLLIEAFLHRHGNLRYVPVDISRSILEESALSLAESYENLEIRAIASEYQEGLRHVGAERERTKMIAWLGSNIGNLTRDEAAAFLHDLREILTDADRLLIGIDLRKNRDTLERAYDDSQGVTARFTLNLLNRINRELGGNFDVDAFEHRCVYDEDEGRVDIHLVSRCEQSVAIDDLELEVDFAPGEGIHAESSHKYSPREIDALAGDSGLCVERRWLDAGSRFSLNLLAPNGGA